MAIAVSQGHVQRAIDFYKKEGKFFVIGGTTPWEPEETKPDSPSTSDYKLKDIVGYQKVLRCELVVPAKEGETPDVTYRTQNWKFVSPPFSTVLVAPGVSLGSKVVPVQSLASFRIGMKVRVSDVYESVIESINASSNQLVLRDPAPVPVSSGGKVQSGALVEGANYVYVECYLNYDQFPIVTYRQIGLCSEVLPPEGNEYGALRAGAYNTNNPGVDEFTSTGVLEILDNRPPSTRDIDQREMLSLILEF